MAVNLTHKLTRCIGTHVEHREDIIEHTFPYQKGGVIEKDGVDWPYTLPYVLKEASSQGAGVHQLKAGGTDIGYWENASKPVTLQAGNYRVKFPYFGALIIYKVTTWEENAYVLHVWTFNNNATVQLAEGQYIIASNMNDTNLDGLKGSLLEVHEYDVVVKDYETTTIEEPIGFDDLQSTLKRHDYHGMGAEVSLGNLEFYGAAFDVIKSAYDADIDTEVLYEVLAGEEIIYSGQIDLSTVSGKQGDYKSVAVKVGEIGVKTTFNNRTESEIDLDEPKTVDGQDVVRAEWPLLYIPVKHLLYTNTSKQSRDSLITTSGGYNSHPETGIEVASDRANKLFIPIGDNIHTEFGELRNASPYGTDNISNVNPQYASTQDHGSQFGPNTITHLKINLNAEAELRDNVLSQVVLYRIVAVTSLPTIPFIDIKKGPQKTIEAGKKKGDKFDFSCSLDCDVRADTTIKYYIEFDIELGSLSSYQFWMHLNVKKGSYVKMTMYDNITEPERVSANMIMVHDAVQTIVSAISENQLSIKSDWYQYADPNSIGGGALKALTNGYKIRGLFTDEDNRRNMPISFKDMIESLSALDCIGWGFSKENDETFVRVERWDWFYKDEVILTLDSVNELQIDVEPDRIPTELKIGYKKYATQDQYNSIDSPHGTRTFINGIKALNKKITKESEFIADNYAIEETRRARTQVSETEETTYDENIFVFELVKTDDEYSIGHTSVNPEKVGNPDEFINAKLTPRHMASRWQDYIFATNNNTPFRFTTGEINYQAVFAVLPEETEADNITTHSLRPFVEDPSVPQAENADIANKHAKFKAEKITFSYPLTIEQYKSVLANPYGLIRLTEGNEIVAEGWIMDFKYKFEDGMADFTLIAKNNQVNE